MNRYILSDGRFEIGLMEGPQISYFRPVNASSLLGGNLPEVVLYDSEKEELVTNYDLFEISYAALKRDDTASYVCTVVYKGNKAVFQIRFTLKNGVIRIESKVIAEQGLKIVTIFFNQLIRTGKTPARIMLTAKGGRLIEPQKCEPGIYEHRYNWIHDSFCNYSLIYNREMSAIVELTSLDDTLYSGIGEDANGKYGFLGVMFRHRYTSKDKPYRKVITCAETNDFASETYPFEEEFVASDSSHVNIHLYNHPVEDINTGWIFGSQQIRSFLPEKRTDFYKDFFVYKVFIGCYGDKIKTSFRQTLELIRKIYDNTMGAKQICYIVGFQHDGHDSNYPDVFTVNAKAGGRAELLSLIKEAKKYNTIVSFHDNYDDAYRESPGWDVKDIGITNKGKLLKGGVWNGKQAYWISLPVYSSTKSIKRIKKTLDMYPIYKTYHLDVLTASVFRLDFREGNPSSKEKDLLGRLNVVRQFRERGIDVTSEAIGSRFMHDITYSWHWERAPRPVFSGDIRIPAAPFIAHGKADYGGSSVIPIGILDGLLYGAFYSDDLTAETPLKEILDGYYMLQVPLNMIRNKKAIDYKVWDGYKQVFYEDNTSIKVNFESLELEVVIEGNLLIKNGSIFLPKENHFIAYTAFQNRYDEYVSFPLQNRYKATKAVFKAISSDKEPYITGMDEGQIKFNIPAGVVFQVMLE